MTGSCITHEHMSVERGRLTMPKIEADFSEVIDFNKKRRFTYRSSEDWGIEIDLERDLGWLEEEVLDRFGYY